MCNLSTMYINQGIAQEREHSFKEKVSTIMELVNMGLSLENIAKATHISTDEATRIIKENTTKAGSFSVSPQ